MRGYLCWPILILNEFRQTTRASLVCNLSLLSSNCTRNVGLHYTSRACAHSSKISEFSDRSRKDSRSSEWAKIFHWLSSRPISLAEQYAFVISDCSRYIGSDVSDCRLFRSGSCCPFPVVPEVMRLVVRPR